MNISQWSKTEQCPHLSKVIHSYREGNKTRLNQPSGTGELIRNTGISVLFKMTYYL